MIDPVILSTIGMHVLRMPASYRDTVRYIVRERSGAFQIEIEGEPTAKLKAIEYPMRNPSVGALSSVRLVRRDGTLEIFRRAYERDPQRAACSQLWDMLAPTLFRSGYEATSFDEEWLDDVPGIVVAARRGSAACRYWLGALDTAGIVVVYAMFGDTRSLFFTECCALLRETFVAPRAQDSGSPGHGIRDWPYDSLDLSGCR